MVYVLYYIYIYIYMRVLRNAIYIYTYRVIILSNNTHYFKVYQRPIESIFILDNF